MVNPRCNAAHLDVPAWLAAKRAEWEEEPDAPIPRSPGATAEVSHEPHILRELSGAAAQNLFIVLLPTRDGCEFPALLMYGDWNSCPTPSEHVAVLKRWRDMHGAEPIALGGDTIELRSHTSLAADASTQVAEEQFFYCPDIVVQGVESIDALAFTLRSGTYWFFWWD